VRATFGRPITLVNLNARVSVAEMNRVAEAINTQLTRDVYPAWHTAASVGVARSPAGVTGAVVYLQQEIDVAGVLGFHGQTNVGVPVAVVSPEVSAALGEDWSVTLSHEVLEMVGNPHADLYVPGPHPITRGRRAFYWMELCDACQDDSYEIGSVRVSNFLLPLYFTEGQEAGAPNDFLRTGIKSLGLRPGGYIGFFDPDTGDEYNLFADDRARARHAVKAGLGAVRRSVHRFGEPSE